MPSNDFFASAAVLSTATSGGVNGTTTGASANTGADTGEPGHYNYAYGPLYPVARAIVGPFASVWYSWTPATSGNYYFTTRNILTLAITNYPSTVQAFVQTGSGVTGLSRVDRPVLLLDQSVGDGNGVDVGASICFTAVAGTTYYIQIDGRNGASGNFKLRWGLYTPAMLGSCAGSTLNTDPSTQCMASIQVNGGSSDAWFSFGSQPVKAGNYRVAYVDGTSVLPYANNFSGGQTFPILSIVDGDMSGFTEWSSVATYVAGNKVVDLENNLDYAAALAVSGSTNVHPFSGGGSCNSQWICYGGTDTIPQTQCAYSDPVPHPATGVIGMIYLAGGTSGISTPYPRYMLLYFPMDTTVLSSSPGFTLSGSGTSWSINFNIQNNSSQDWDNTTVTLLNTGGVTGASGAISGLTLTHGASTATGGFTFTATPGLVTATIQISRNGQVACTLSYPLFPVVSLAFWQSSGVSGLNIYERTGCTPAAWVQSLAMNTSWAANLPASWGNTVALVFSVVSGGATLTNDQAANVCLSVANITKSSFAIGAGWQYGVIKPGFWVTGALQNVPIQCTLAWNSASGAISLPTFTQTLSIPPT